MVSGQRVLVVDGLSETEQVLKAVLEPRGLQVDRIRSGRSDETLAGQRPSVVVLHMDDEKPRVTDASDDVPRVIIGTADLPALSTPGEHYLQHPFHYGELIQAIETLIAPRAA